MKFHPDNGFPERQSQVTRRRNDALRLDAASHFGTAYAIYDFLGPGKVSPALKIEIENALRQPLPQRKYTTKKEEAAFRSGYQQGARKLVSELFANMVREWSKEEREKYWSTLSAWAEMKSGIGLPRIVGGRPQYSDIGAEEKMLPTFLAKRRQG